MVGLPPGEIMCFFVPPAILIPIIGQIEGMKDPSRWPLGILRAPNVVHLANIGSRGRVVIKGQTDMDVAGRIRQERTQSGTARVKLDGIGRGARSIGIRACCRERGCGSLLNRKSSTRKGKEDGK